MSSELKLTKLDRLILINQLRIMESLYLDEAPQLSVQREALECGYEMIYGFSIDHILDNDDKMTDEECREVWDTFDMFVAVANCLHLMSPDFNISGYRLTKFAGYDGNHEAKFLSFARFTVERLRRFEHLPMEKPHYWNSHTPMRDTYKRMWTKWQALPPKERGSMTSEQLGSVLAAATSR